MIRGEVRLAVLPFQGLGRLCGCDAGPQGFALGCRGLLRWGAGQEPGNGVASIKLTIGIPGRSAMVPPMSTSRSSPALPSGLRLDRTDAGFLIHVQWRNMASWALLPLGLVAAGIPVMLVFKTRVMPWNHPIQALPAIFGVVALIFAFVVIRRLVNTTQIEVTPERLRISHGPLPWQRPVEVSSATIRRIEVRPSRWRYDGAEVIHHHLWVVHNDGKETCLLERDATAEQSSFLCEEIQRVLGAGVENGAAGRASKVE